MSEAKFVVAYDGPAVADGDMEVADLAPALLHLAQLLDAAAKVVDGKDAKVSLKVTSTAEGSFEIWFSLAMEGAAAGWQWWKTDDVQAAAALISLLGFTGISGGLGLLNVIRFLRGRTPKSSESADDGNIKLVLENDVTITIPLPIYHLMMDSRVRANLEGVIADPLDKVGIESVRFGPKDHGTVITDDEAFAFRAPLELDADLFVNRYRRAFSIVSLSFKDGQKWRLNDGHGPKYVAMSDAEFVDKVDRSEIRFAKGDILICDVIERSSRGAKGLKAEYEITKVIEHQPASIQPPLPQF